MLIATVFNTCAIELTNSFSSHSEKISSKYMMRLFNDMYQRLRSITPIVPLIWVPAKQLSSDLSHYISALSSRKTAFLHASAG